MSGVTSQPSYAFISADGTVDVVPGALSASKLQGQDRLSSKRSLTVDWSIVSLAFAAGLRRQ